MPKTMLPFFAAKVLIVRLLRLQSHKNEDLKELEDAAEPTAHGSGRHSSVVQKQEQVRTNITGAGNCWKLF